MGVKRFNDIVLIDGGILVSGVSRFNLKKIMDSNQFPYFTKLNNFYYIPLTDKILKVGQIYTCLVFLNIDLNYFNTVVCPLFGLEVDDINNLVEHTLLTEETRKLVSNRHQISKISLPLDLALLKTFFNRDEIRLLSTVLVESEIVDDYYMSKLPSLDCIKDSNLDFLDKDKNTIDYIQEVYSKINLNDLDDLYEKDKNCRLEELENIGFNKEDARKFSFYYFNEREIFLVDSQEAERNLFKYLNIRYKNPRRVKRKGFFRKRNYIEYDFKIEEELEEKFGESSSMISLYLNF